MLDQSIELVSNLATKLSRISFTSSGFSNCSQCPPATCSTLRPGAKGSICSGIFIAAVMTFVDAINRVGCVRTWAAVGISDLVLVKYGSGGARERYPGSGGCRGEEEIQDIEGGIPYFAHLLR